MKEYLLSPCPYVPVKFSVEAGTSKSKLLKYLSSRLLLILQQLFGIHRQSICFNEGPLSRESHPFININNISGRVIED